MSRLFQSILVCADHYRKNGFARDNPIALAKKLQSSLRVAYGVDLKDLQVFAPGPPSGESGRWVYRGTPKEAELVAEGSGELEQFRTVCEEASVRYSGDLFVGSSEMVWAGEARSSDLLMILPVDEDFWHFERWLGSMFWRIAARSCRPVLLFRRDEVPKNGAVLFYSNRLESARALPYVSTLCSTLEMPLTVYSCEVGSRDYARRDECKTFLEEHQITATFSEEEVLEVLAGEAKHPGSQIEEPSLLVFDRGFHKGLWFQKRRRVVEQLIRTSQHWILLCP